MALKRGVESLEGDGGVCLLTGHHVGTKKDPDGGDEWAKHHHEANEEPETSSWQQQGPTEENKEEKRIYFLFMVNAQVVIN